MNKRRVVITGIGAISPLGSGHQDIWKALLEGRSGVSKISHFDPEEHGLAVKIAAEVKNFNIADFYPDKRKVGSMLKEMDRVTLFAMAAAKLALEDARLEIRSTQPERVGTFIGTGVGGLITTTADHIKLMEGGPKKIGLRSIIRLMPNAPSGQVAIEHGAKGRAKSDATACASGLDSLFDAYMYITQNRADAMIAGGSEACINPFSVASFTNMMALSRRNDPPEKVSRPFSIDRDGFVIGEGSVILILEELGHALKRNAPIYAEIIGGGASCDATHIVAPDETGSGAARAIREALRDAEIEPTDIDYINAHGTSTPLNDERETLAIKKVFNSHAYKIAVSSTKSMVGHLLGGAGAIGAAATALTIRDQKMHPTINYNNPDPKCDLDYIPNVCREGKVNHAIVEALGFGGHNTVLVMGKYVA
ncbi:MAG: beta-ketoacyl-[acyl-carrier-protein] synthase II [Candidatus Melainabacteria bacterium]|nr:MAG: beta-ketoacyl-[acyl-carrier-protein] synthase II [Candidatus Melainabacteria bacterium]